MWILFGWHDIKKDLGTGTMECAVCEDETVHAHQSEWLWFTVFFLPILPLGTRRFVVRCAACGHAAPALERVEFVQRLSGPLASGGGHGATTAPAAGKKCPQCAERIKVEARICRFCGHAFDEGSVARVREASQAQLRAASEQDVVRRTAARARRFRWAGGALVTVGVLMAMGAVANLPEPRETGDLGAWAVSFLIAVVAPLWGGFSLFRKGARGREASIPVVLVVHLFALAAAACGGGGTVVVEGRSGARLESINLNVFTSTGPTGRSIDLTEGQKSQFSAGESVSINFKTYTAKAGGATIELRNGQVELSNVDVAE